MTATAQPSLTACRRKRFVSEASGVVRTASSLFSPIRYSTVVNIAAFCPAASAKAKQRYVVVVLPFVPVIPTRSSLCEGSPYTTAAARASALRASVTFSHAPAKSAGGSNSEIIPAAPRRITSSTNRCPSTVEPLIATNNVPSLAARESCVTSIAEPFVSPKTSAARASATCFTVIFSWINAFSRSSRRRGIIRHERKIARTSAFRFRT